MLTDLLPLCVHWHSLIYLLRESADSLNVDFERDGHTVGFSNLR